MFDLCNLLQVGKTEVVPDHFLVEACSIYDVSLEGIYILCPESAGEQIKAWIHDNLRHASTHCSDMFNKNPSAVLAFIISSQQLDSYTAEMVRHHGGTQEFIDYYFKTDRNMEDTATDSDILEMEEKFQTEDSEVEKTLTDSLIESPIEIDNSQSDTETERSPFRMDEVTDELLQEDNSEMEEISMSDENANIKEDLADVEAADVELNAVKLNDIDLIRAEMHEEEHSPHEEIPMISKQSADTLTDPNADKLEQILEFIERLSKENSEEVNSEKVLSKEDIDVAMLYLDNFSPSVFKAFIFWLTQRSETDLDLKELSKLLDKFLTFANTFIEGEGI